MKKYGFVKRVNNCKIIETYEWYVVTNQNGLTIGQSKTLLGAEGIAESYNPNNKKVDHTVI